MQKDKIIHNEELSTQCTNIAAIESKKGGEHKKNLKWDVKAGIQNKKCKKKNEKNEHIK